MLRVLFSLAFVFVGVLTNAFADTLEQKWVDQRAEINPIGNAANEFDLVAYDRLLALAEKDRNPVAMHNMAWLYYQKIDFYERYRLLPSKDGKFPPSGKVYEIYVSTEEGDDPIQTMRAQACVWWERAAQAGYPYSQLSYSGQCLKPKISKRGSGDDYENQMIALLTASAKAGKAYAAVFLSDYLAPWPHPIPKEKRDLFMEIVDIGWNAKPSEEERSQLHGNVSIFKAHHDSSYVPDGFLSVAEARDCYKASESLPQALGLKLAKQDEWDLRKKEKDLLEVIQDYQDQRFINQASGQKYDLSNCGDSDVLCQTTKKAKDDHDEAAAELTVLRQQLSCAKRITNAVYNTVCFDEPNAICKRWR